MAVDETDLAAKNIPDVGEEVLSEEETNTILESIRTKRRELFENRSTYISIPGYEEIGLVAQYHLLDGKELDMIGDKVKRQVKNKVDRGILSAVDVFIAACDGLYLSRDGGTYVPFDPGRRGTPLRYEPELGSFIGADGADTARKVVFALFGDNDAAIGNHSMKLNRWFMNTTRDADEELLGE
jgi:hypothetical protein